MKNYKYIIKNLDCANCAKKIENKLSNTEGYKNVVLNFATLRLSFQTDKEDNIKEEVQKIISEIEPEVMVIEENEKQKAESIKSDLIRLVLRNSFIFYFYGYSDGKYYTYYSYNIIIYYITLQNSKKSYKTII